MKKIILFLTVLLTAAFSQVHAKSCGDTTINATTCIATLIINADVTVVLVDNVNTETKAVGSEKLIHLVQFKTAGDTLTISTVKNKKLVGEGIVYVSASNLRKLQINSAASVRSFYFLRRPKIDVVVNGACTFTISNTGGLNLTETSDYVTEHSSETRPLPPGFLPVLSN